MNPDISKTRRNFLHISVTAGAGLILNGCRSIQQQEAGQLQDNSRTGKKVTAAENLMREHGILRRALLIYSEIIARLDTNNFSDVTISALQRTTRLFRIFGKEHHAEKLEEAYIFPVVIQTGGQAAAYPDILTAQHQRGNELLEYILTAAQKGLDGGSIEWLVRALKSFVLMYQNHTAREDTVIFPAWKQILTVQQLTQMDKTFEEIGHRTFGDKGFENMVQQISDIEETLNLSNLAQFTAIPPPKTF